MWGGIPGQEQNPREGQSFLFCLGKKWDFWILMGITLKTQGSISQNRFKVLRSLGTGEWPMGYPRSEVGTRTG